MASIGDLLRRFHRAASGFVAPPDARWQGGFTPGCVPSVVCHNDPVVGNVVFSGERAIALINFDFAGPYDPLRDLAIAAQHWVPLADPEDLIGASTSWSPSERLLGMADSYALARENLGRLLDLVDAYLERGREGVRTRVEAGQERFIAYWEAGLGDRLARALGWVRAERDALV